MNFNSITPEQAGVNSKTLLHIIKKMDDRGLFPHSILLMKGNNIFFEAYYPPFNKDYLHRQYSATKSFVGIAIGLLIDEGKLSLNDKIVDFFPDKIRCDIHHYLKKQTIKDMLTMKTAMDCPNWFKAEDDDRVSHYLNSEAHRPSGLIYRYDSDGSEVLCCLVERLTGKKIMDYLKEKIFDEMDSFKDAYMLEVPHGYSWGDSGLMASARDMASAGYLLLNNGKYNDKQLISESYVKEATSKVVSNIVDQTSLMSNTGYGYQIWQLGHGSFGFVGMGNQLVYVNRENDTTFVMNADDQNNPPARETILGYFADILDEMSEGIKKENKKDYDELMSYLSSLCLQHLKGEKYSPFVNEINNKRYIFKDNPINFKWLELSFENEEGILKYENKTGIKEIHFGMNKNVFTYFPEEGYSDLVGRIVTKNHFYQSANSAIWEDEHKLHIKVCIIDKYFGQLDMLISFKDNCLYVQSIKIAENFLDEYYGEAFGELAK